MNMYRFDPSKITTLEELKDALFKTHQLEGGGDWTFLLANMDEETVAKLPENQRRHFVPVMPDVPALPSRPIGLLEMSPAQVAGIESDLSIPPTKGT